MSSKKTSNTSENKLIAQGSYGCVYSPEIHCKDDLSSKSNKNSISKILDKKDASDELKEYKHIDEIDPKFKYHIDHKTCFPDIKEIEKIKKNETTKYEKCDLFQDVDINDLQLIQMDYGGITIYDFFEKYINNQSGKFKNIDKTGDIFFKKFINLFEGIKLFNDKGFIHFDIKENNILYNVKDEKFIFIDFGLSTKKDEITQNKDLENSKNNLLFAHYPLDIFFYNKPIFDSFEHLLKYELNNSELSNELIEYFFENIQNKYIKYQYYFLRGDQDKFDDYCIFFIKKIIKFILKGGSYDKYMKICMNTFDIYSLGLVLKYSIIQFTNLGYFTGKDKFETELNTFADKITTYDFELRLEPKTALDEYKKIINEYIEKSFVSKVVTRVKSVLPKNPFQKTKRNGGKNKKYTRKNGKK